MNLFRRSSETHVVRVRNLVWLGKTTAEIGRRSTARRCFHRALELDPRCEEAWLWQAGLADNREQALACLDKALAINPNSMRAKAGRHWAQQHLASMTAKRRATPRTSRVLSAIRRLLVYSLVITAVLILIVVIRHPQDKIFSLPPSPFKIGIASKAVSSPLAPNTVESPIVEAALLTTTTASSAESNLVALPTGTPVVLLTPETTSLPLLSTPTVSLPPEAAEASAGLPTIDDGSNEKRIEIDLSAQTLVAYEGDVPVFMALVSTGAAGTPTIVGQFRIYRKLLKQDMSGPGYYLADVPYVQYFFGTYAIHGTYWHNDFGRPVSHGCVNLTVEDAQWLFNWTEPALAPGECDVQSLVSLPGTLVIVRE